MGVGRSENAVMGHHVPQQAHPLGGSKLKGYR